MCASRGACGSWRWESEKLPVLQAAVSGGTRTTPLDLVVERARDVTMFTDQNIRRSRVAPDQ